MGASGSSMTDVVDAYARPSLGAPGRWDEMVDPTTGVRDAWSGVGSMLRLLGAGGLTDQRRSVAAMLAQQGVTYRPVGAEHDRPWSLDPVPLLVEEAEWAALEPALVQRTELLDLILTDLYGPRRLLAEGLLPAEIVFGHPGFVRAVDQVKLPAARQLFMSATDLVRGPDGRWIALGDRTQAPSGTGYAMANRQVVSRTLPGLFRDTGTARLTPFFQAMRIALQALAPRDAEVPRIVLLTTGPGSETAYDQAFLSSLLGFPLVQGNDLVVRDGRLWQRAIGRLERVDVVLRRVDADFCDPLELRADSRLGVPGLIEACRLGTVSVVNSLGTGVLENPALFPYLPRLAQVLLGTPLLLPSARTWWCGDRTSRQHVLAHLPELVLKPVSRGTRSASIAGWELSAQALDQLQRRIAANPAEWVGQEAVDASTAPGASGAGTSGLEARPVTLRSFAVADGGSYQLLAGGLVRVGSDPTARIVTGGSTATSKDAWVLTGTPLAGGETTTAPGHRRVGAVVSPRVAETLFWLGRYAERAEDVSRLVQVTDTLWRDVHPGADPALGAGVEVLLRAVLSVTSAPGTQSTLPPDEAPVHRHLFSVIGDRTRVGTLVHDVRRMLELAVASRDQLSVDTWAVIGDVGAVLDPFDLAPPGAGARFDRDIPSAMARLRAALMAFAGLAHESMVRDTGWHFLDAGRRLERALQLARLLFGTLVSPHGAAVDAVVEEHVLVAAESIITHRRTYPARSGAATVLELLLLDRDNPRSMAFQLDRLATDVRRLGASDGLDGQVSAVAARLSAADPEHLAAMTVGAETRATLSTLLTATIDDLHRLADDVDAAHFDHDGELRQLVPLGEFA